MDARMTRYLVHYVETLLDIRKAITSFQRIAPSEKMIVEPYYTSLCSLGHKDAVDYLLSLPKEKLSNINNMPAFKKLLVAAAKEFRSSAEATNICQLRLAGMLYYIKGVYDALPVAADISEVQAKGYATILDTFADGRNICKLKKHPQVVIPVLKDGYYTGTSICLMYSEHSTEKNEYWSPIAGMLMFIIQQEEAYAMLELQVLESDVYDILINANTLVNGTRPDIIGLHYDNGKAYISTSDNDGGNSKLHTSKTAEAFMEFYALVHLVLSQLDTIEERVITHKHKHEPTTVTVKKPRDDEFHFVPVIRYAYAKAPNRGEGTGESRPHGSPREHERAGHYRHYKSGKVVFIKSTTVNKGHAKTMYKASKYYKKGGPQE